MCSERFTFDWLPAEGESEAVLEFNSAERARSFKALVRRLDRRGATLTLRAVGRELPLWQDTLRLPDLEGLDPVTQLPVRAQITTEIDALLEMRESGAIGIIDVDGLKRTNDTFGFEAGDVVIRALAARLATMTQNRGWRIGRLEGDKLVVLAGGADATTELLDVLAIACRTFRVELSQQVASIPATATAGVAAFRRHGVTARDLLRNADIALDRAKLNRRGAALVFTNAMRRSWQQETDALAKARTALDRDLIVPFYQPKMAPTSGRIVGWEALLRIRRGRQHDLPHTIAQALDDPDLSKEIGLRMRSKVLSQIALWQTAGVDTGVVSLNASPTELASVGFAHRFLADLVDFGVLPSSVGVEVTESAVIGGNSSKIATELRQLKSLGVNIALDDFGTGYGSLIHMMDFPLDAIKVDRAFVASLEVSNRARAILAALATLTRDLGLQLVAEGVETDEQLSRLACIGCDLVQGYLVGKPMPAGAITTYLSER